jgi:hypothetical protein
MPGMLVLDVTRDGHSRSLAEEFARLVGVEAMEIVDLVNRKGFFGFMRSGNQAAVAEGLGEAERTKALEGIRKELGR